LKFVVLLDWSEAVYIVVQNTQNDRGIFCLELRILRAKLVEVSHTEFEQNLWSFYRLGREHPSWLLMNWYDRRLDLSHIEMHGDVTTYNEKRRYFDASWFFLRRSWKSTDNVMHRDVYDGHGKAHHTLL